MGSRRKESTRPSKKQPTRQSACLAVGQPFNPYRMFNGVLIPERLVRYKDISPGAKLAWGRLARYAGRDGKCYPAMKTLGAELGVSERMAQKYVSDLECAGLIRRKARRENGTRIKQFIRISLASAKQPSTTA